MKVSRESLIAGVDGSERTFVKQTKMDCTLMWGGLDALDFLLSVQLWRESGIGAEIQKQATLAID